MGLHDHRARPHVLHLYLVLISFSQLHGLHLYVSDGRRSSERFPLWGTWPPEHRAYMFPFCCRCPFVIRRAQVLGIIFTVIFAVANCFCFINLIITAYKDPGIIPRQPKVEGRRLITLSWTQSDDYWSFAPEGPFQRFSKTIRIQVKGVNVERKYCGMWFDLVVSCIVIGEEKINLLGITPKKLVIYSGRCAQATVEFVITVWNVLIIIALGKCSQ